MSTQTAWNLKKPAPTISFAHLMQQELEDQKFKEQETKDFQLALSLQEELGHPQEFISTDQPSSSSSSSYDSSIDPDLLLAMKLQAELNGEPFSPPPHASSLQSQGTTLDDDHLIALQIQAEFDQDFNRYLSAKERQANANSNVRVSLDNYRLSQVPSERTESLDYEEDDDGYCAHLEGGNKLSNARSGGLRRPGKKSGGAGPASGKKEIVTKHDIETNSLKNARRMERLPAIEIGNTSKVKDLRVPYKVFNSLKNHAVKEAARQDSRGKTRLFDKDDTATQDSVLDKRTRLILHQMINKEILDEVEGILSTGKESNVYYGLAFNKWVDEEDQDEGSTKKASKKKQKRQPEEEQKSHKDESQEEEEAEVVECAIKIFKTSLQEFRNRDDYIRDDARYVSRLSRHNNRKLIKLWAEKEMLNLFRLQRAGIPSPEVLHYDQHILVLSFIGRERKAAPKLKEVGKLVTPHKREELYEQCIQGMRKMYQEARLVHADLSEYNLLYFNHQLYFIDVSQAVETLHPNSSFFLLRDCFNVTRFFRSIGVEKALSELELFSYVTKETLSAQGEEELTKEIQAFVKERLGENVQVSLRDADVLQVLDRLFPSFVSQSEMAELEKEKDAGSNGSVSTEEEDEN